MRPIKVGRASLQQHGDVAEPERSHSAVTQQVKAEKTKMIFLAQNSHLCVVKPNQMRARENGFGLLIAEFAEARMQINIARAALRIIERGLRRPVLIR